jgi:hypothetical protein
LLLFGITLGTGAVAACNVLLGLEAYQDCPEQGPCPDAGGIGGASSTSGTTMASSGSTGGKTASSSSGTGGGATTSSSTGGTTCGTSSDAGADDGACLLANGQKCTQGSDCASTYCTDGVCCNTVCNNTPCYACSAKLTGGMDGTCAPATDGTVDPRGLCNDEPVASCGYDGKCSGGFCSGWPVGSVCGNTPCNGYVNLLQCSGQGGSCDGGTGATQVKCPAFCSVGGSYCGCNTGSDCPAQLPNCVIPPCSPSCSASEFCCNGGCSATSCTNAGYCSP